MSVTITISGNREYFEANGGIPMVEYDCQTCEFEGPDPACVECLPYGGKGKVRLEALPFNGNICSSNLYRIWALLGLDPETDGDCYGQIDGADLLERLKKADPMRLVQETVEATGSGGCHVVYCGTDEDAARNYIRFLTEMAEEAIRRDKLIWWG